MVTTPAEPGQVPQMMRDIRRQLGLSQEELARRLGVSYPTVNAWERGRAHPYPRHLKAITTLHAKSGAGETVAPPAVPAPLVLVVEDDPASALVLQDFCRLALPAWRVELAHGGYEAMLRIGLSRPALLLLDLMMPEVDGFKVFERLRALPELSATEVIIVTAASDDAVLDRARALGPLALLRKPVRAADLLPVLRAAGERLAPSTHPV